jgi:hypothetical protein
MTAIYGHEAAPNHPAPQQHRVGLPALWFGLFGAPAAWAAQLISNYALMSHFCYPRDTPLASPTFGGVRPLAIVIAAILLLVAVAALFVALHSWNATRYRRDSEHREIAEIGEGRTRFMAMAGILVSGIFVYGVLMAGIPLIAMPVCQF